MESTVSPPPPSSPSPPPRRPSRLSLAVGQKCQSSVEASPRSGKKPRSPTPGRPAKRRRNVAALSVAVTGSTTLPTATRPVGSINEPSVWIFDKDLRVYNLHLIGMEEVSSVNKQSPLTHKSLTNLCPRLISKERQKLCATHATQSSSLMLMVPTIKKMKVFAIFYSLHSSHLAHVSKISKITSVPPVSR